MKKKIFLLTSLLLTISGCNNTTSSETSNTISSKASVTPPLHKMFQ